MREAAPSATPNPNRCVGDRVDRKACAMRFITMILCVFVAFAAAGCEETPEFQELKDGRQATVYACGAWAPENLTQIQAAIDDWNTAVGPRYGMNPFVYGGQLLDAAPYDESSASDGIHCIYRLEPGKLTAFGQDVWNEHRDTSDPEAGTFMDNDDILTYWTLGDALLPNWSLQPTIAHELGHGAGLGHTDEDAAFDSVMKPRRSAAHVQSFDADEFGRFHGC